MESHRANTTYATNLALQNLFYSSYNRDRKGRLVVQPMLMVHDALAGQFPTKLQAECLEVLKKAFKNTLHIHGVEVEIPSECKIGENWKDLEEVR